MVSDESESKGKKLFYQRGQAKFNRSCRKSLMSREQFSIFTPLSLGKNQVIRGKAIKEGFKDVLKIPIIVLKLDMYP